MQWEVSSKMVATPVPVNNIETSFPLADWFTTDQAENMAADLAAELNLNRVPKLDSHDLRKHCRKRFGPLGLAVFISRDGIITGENDYVHVNGGRGIWLVHKDAIIMRLKERSRGPGNPHFREKGQPGVRDHVNVVIPEMATPEA